MNALWEQCRYQKVQVIGTHCTWYGTLQGLDDIGLELAEPDRDVVFIPWTAVLCVRKEPD